MRRYKNDYIRQDGSMKRTLFEMNQSMAVAHFQSEIEKHGHSKNGQRKK